MTMKKLAALLLTLTLAVTAMAIPAAADAGQKDTTATVTFEADSSGPGGASLYLEKVPTFDFGSHTISPSDETYAANAANKLLRVVDGRGAGTGWNVTATASPFTSLTTSTPLAGSRITITGGTITYGASALTPPSAPTQPGSITLNTNNVPVAVLTATAEQGRGIWDDNLDIVNLEVPGSAALAEAYEATITWTLSDVPA